MFFEYAVVFAGESFPDDVRTEAIAAVRSRVLHGPYVEVRKLAKSSRSFGFGRVSSAPWVHVAAKRDPDDDSSPSSWAGEMSSDLGCPVVWVKAFDSDDITMMLWDMGEIVDAFSSTKDEESLRFFHPEAVGNGSPELWAHVLPRDRRPEDLRRCWDTPRILIEEMAQEASDILGWDPDYWAGGVRVMEHWPDDDDLWLHFK